MTDLILHSPQQVAKTEAMALRANHLLDELPPCPVCQQPIGKAVVIRHNYGGRRRKLRVCSQSCKSEVLSVLGEGRAS